MINNGIFFLFLNTLFCYLCCLLIQTKPYAQLKLLQTENTAQVKSQVPGTASNPSARTITLDRYMVKFGSLEWNGIGIGIGIKIDFFQFYV